MADDLKKLQDAGQQVERDMLQFLLQYDPANVLTLADAKQIAGRARRLAFDQFSELLPR